MAERFVILGHTGYVGSRLQAHLAVRHPGIPILGVSSREADLADPGQSRRLAALLAPDDVVIMCAGIKSNYGDNFETCAGNLRMAENVGRVLAGRPVRRFIFFSSIAVYGVDRHLPRITEDTPADPDTPYGLSKFASERLLSFALAGRAACSLVLLRTSTIYGPGEKIVAPTPSGFLTTCLRGGEIALWGDGSELREFLFVEDLVRAVDGLAGSDFAGVLNLGGGQARSYRDAVRIIGDLLGRAPAVRPKPRTKAPVDKVYDLSLFRRLFPDFVFTPLEAGLKAMARQQG